MAGNIWIINRNDNFLFFGFFMENRETRKIYSVCTIFSDERIFVFDYNLVFGIIAKKKGMKRRLLNFVILIVLCGFPAFYAAAAVSLFSDYGQIQNVQNYSSNPFWSPNAPYNQRFPQPVYAGNDFSAVHLYRGVLQVGKSCGSIYDTPEDLYRDHSGCHKGL